MIIFLSLGHFFVTVSSFVFAQGIKSYQTSKFESVYFLSKTGLTFLLWLITFEPLEKKQSYIPLLKVLMCGMNARGGQQDGGTFILRNTSMKMVVLLHKTARVNFPMATTVVKCNMYLLLFICMTTFFDARTKIIFFCNLTAPSLGIILK